MRTLLLIPASLAVTALAGVAALAALGRTVHPASAAVAGAIVFVACAAALVPLLLARHATQLGLSQAALAGTMVHLFVAIALAAVVILAKLLPGNAFPYWLLAFYWTTLAALAVVFVRAVQAAPPAATNSATAPPTTTKA